MLHGKVFRSAEPHARPPRSTPARRAMPGVRAVMTAADAADVRYGAREGRAGLRLGHRALSCGQPVAAVAADHARGRRGGARGASRSMYEPLPPVFDLPTALAAGRAARPRGMAVLRRGPDPAARAATCAIAHASSSATSSAAWRRPTASSSTASPPRWCTRATPSRARPCVVGQLGAGAGLVERRSFPSTCRSTLAEILPSRPRRFA